MVIPLIEDAMSKHSPYGGVTNPNANVVTTINPKIIGLIPSATADGKIIGTNKIIAGTESINVPTNIKNNTTTNKNTNLPPGILVKNCCTYTLSW